MPPARAIPPHRESSRVDTLTHALSGALLARATGCGVPRPGALPPGPRIAAGFLAAAFPDCDFALRLIDTLTYLNWHQGLTHSLLLAPAWAWVLAHLFSRATRRRYAPAAFFGVAVLGIAVHIAGDLLTAYGTMLFAPLTTQRFAFPWIFVIDPYFTGIIAIGLAATLLRPANRSIAAVALLALASYTALLGTLHYRALGVGAAYAAARGLVGAEMHALAQPLTPFNRKIIVRHQDSYHEAMVNLWRRRPVPPLDPDAGTLRRIAAGYRPLTAAKWTLHSRFGETPSRAALAREAWNQEVFAGFRHFAVFPALDGIDVAEGRVCVWFVDLRFVLPDLPPSFRYGVCRSGSPEGWQLVQSRGFFWID